jgi:DNA-binding response OmpR family regulator
VPASHLCFRAGVLLISSDEEDCISLRQFLDPVNWTLHLAQNPAEAERTLRNEPVAAVLTDSRYWKDMLRYLWTMESPPALVVADRLADERLWAEVLNLGAFDLLTKPFAAKEVLHVLSAACRREKDSLASLSLKVRGCSEGQPVEMLESAMLAHPR